MLVESFSRLFGRLGWCVDMGLVVGPVRGRPSGRERVCRNDAGGWGGIGK